MTSRLVIKAGTLLDGKGNKSHNQALILQGECITNIVSISEFHEQTDDDIIDATNHTVMPGLVDGHVHTFKQGDPDEPYAAQTLELGDFALNSLRNAQHDLEAGFTTIRDLASIGFVDVALKRAIESGRFTGPRMRVSGHGLSMWGGHMHWNRGLRRGLDTIETMGVVNTPDETKACARYQISRGVDCIKFNVSGSSRSLDKRMVIRQEMDYEMLKMGVMEAKKNGLMTAAHCHGGQGATDAIEAGVDTLEHGHFLTDEHFERMLKQGTILVPTLCPNEKLFERGRKGSGSTEESWDWLQGIMEVKTEMLHRALKAGVPVAAGSDAGTRYNYHGENAREMEFMVLRGMTPMQAITAMTFTAARATQLDAFTGSLEPGKWADVLVVAGNPLEDIKVLNEKERILKIIKQGKILIDRQTKEPSCL